MRLLLKIFAVICLILIDNNFSYSQKKDVFVPKVRNYFGIDYYRTTSSSYYEFDGTEYPTIIDSLDNLHKNEYSYNSLVNQFNLSISQVLFSTSNFSLFAKADLPINFNSIESKYQKLSELPSGVDSDTVYDVEFAYESTNIPYLKFGIGADYQYSNFYFGLGLNANISFLNEDITDVNKKQLFDRYYTNVSPYVSVIYKGAKSFLEFEGHYKAFLNSPISDIFKLKVGVGITTVESSVLGAYLEYNKSTTSIDNSVKFNPSAWQLQEEFFKFGTYFDVLIEDMFLPGISYDLTISGKNSLNVGIFRLYLKFLLDLNK